MRSPTLGAAETHSASISTLFCLGLFERLVWGVDVGRSDLASNRGVVLQRAGVSRLSCTELVCRVLSLHAIQAALDLASLEGTAKFFGPYLSGLHISHARDIGLEDQILAHGLIFLGRANSPSSCSRRSRSENLSHAEPLTPQLLPQELSRRTSSFLASIPPMQMACPPA